MQMSARAFATLYACMTVRKRLYELQKVTKLSNFSQVKNKNNNTEEEEEEKNKEGKMQQQ